MPIVPDFNDDTTHVAKTTWLHDNFSSKANFESTLNIWGIKAKSCNEMVKYSGGIGFLVVSLLAGAQSIIVKHVEHDEAVAILAYVQVAMILTWIVLKILYEVVTSCCKSNCIKKTNNNNIQENPNNKIQENTIITLISLSAQTILAGVQTILTQYTDNNQAINILSYLQLGIGILALLISGGLKITSNNYIIARKDAEKAYADIPATAADKKDDTIWATSSTDSDDTPGLGFLCC